MNNNNTSKDNKASNRLNDALYSITRIIENYDNLFHNVDVDNKEAVMEIINQIVDGIKSDSEVLKSLIIELKENKKKNQSAAKIISEASAYYTIYGANKAFEYFQDKLKEDANAPVYMSLGDLYYYGIGVDKNLELALKYYQKAIQRNETEFSFADNLADEYFLRALFCIDSFQDFKSPHGVIKYLEKAFEFGSIEAALELGKMFLDERIVARNDEKAIEYFKKGARQGALDQEYRPNFDKINTAKIFNSLGYMYIGLANEYKKLNHCEVNVVETYQKAMGCFMKAASLDFALAYYHIGVMYANGKGVVKDYFEAIKWFESASALGCEEADRMLLKLNSKMGK